MNTSDDFYFTVLQDFIHHIVFNISPSASGISRNGCRYRVVRFPCSKHPPEDLSRRQKDNLSHGPLEIFNCYRLPFPGYSRRLKDSDRLSYRASVRPASSLALTNMIPPKGPFRVQFGLASPFMSLFI